MGPLGSAPSEAYASPTRVQSHSGIYGNVAHQVSYAAILVAASNGVLEVVDAALLHGGWLQLVLPTPLRHFL
jgi:hypothetical protein